jgi:5,10-methenyltetrahydromethanopterin hydrogenase
LYPTSKKIKLEKGLDDDATTWFTMDGEAKQIMPMMGQESQSLLNDNSIIVTKPPGSTSHVTQPADVGNIFKAIKTTLGALKDIDMYDRLK